jgi:hypothetical protein
MAYAARKEPCGWEAWAGVRTREELENFLMCASGFGCYQCVACSERALDHLRQLNSVRGTPPDSTGDIAIL